jgi:filamentous hemagglutinin family protein
MPRAPHVWRELLLATTCLVAASSVGYAGSTVQPGGFSVAAGSGGISAPNPTTTIIRQTTDKAVFNWSSFSISSGASVAFQQPGSSSIALNRVSGAEASRIDGSLTANGQVWIVNPHGVLFGAGAQVNVGGLLATTADIRDQDFLAGNYSFSGATGAAIVNQGEIRAASGGSVVLAGAQVKNSGLIQADLGTVQLAAGKSFALDLTGDKLIRFQVTEAVDVTPLGTDGKAVDSLITNTGTLRAAGGRVLLTARAAKNVVDSVINTTGIIEATTASMINGEIVLDGGDAGTVQVAGRLDASGKAAGQTGGKVSVLGNKISLGGAARIDVSGDAGGGTALIGGGAHGAGPQPNATITLVAGGASLKADALTNGSGGTVVLWSESSTSFAGSISAKGGRIGGNGGFVETSSRGALGVSQTARVDTAAPGGKVGSWLLDPRNITVQAGGSAAVTDVSAFGNQPSTGLTIDPTPINNASSNVTLQANNDIAVNAAIAMTNSGVGLSLQAGRSVLVNADITTTNGAVDIQANRAFDPGNRLAGVGTVTMSPGTTINTGSAGIDLFVSQSGPSGGPITVANLTTTGLTNVENNGSTNGGILAASPSSLIAAGSLSLDAGTIAGSAIGTDALPIRVATTTLAAVAASDIVIASPSGGVGIGTVSGNSGIVSTLGGKISLSAAGTIIIGADLTTSGGSISLTGPAILAGVDKSTPTSVKIDSTNGGAAPGGNDILLGGTVDGSYSGQQALTLAAGTAGNIALNGTVGGGTALSSLAASGGTISLASVSTLGDQTYTGTTTIRSNATLTTSGGAVTFNSNLRLAGVDASTPTLVTIDSTNGGVAPAGADIVFGGTVDGSFSRQQSLTLGAGTAGDITFKDTVGQALNGGAFQLGDVTITSTLNFTTTFTAAAQAQALQFAAKSFTLLNGKGSVSMPTGLRTRLPDNQTVRKTSGSVSIDTVGTVSIGSFNSDPNLTTGISARGADATLNNAVAGNGGTISISGARIELPGFITARGGDVSGAASGNAGNMGAVALKANGGTDKNGDPIKGDVIAGIDVNNSAFMRGGNSISGSGGNAASFTISAVDSITLPGGIAALGGNAGGVLGNGGNAGALSLTATNGDIVIGAAATKLAVATSGGNAAVSSGSALGTGGSGKAITMDAGGAILVFGPIFTSGGQGTQTADASGAIMINQNHATLGIHTIGNVSLGSTATSGFAVNSSGHSADTTNESSGNAGAISITGANIFLPNGAAAGGGSGTVAGSSGGNAAPITLTATNGLVVVGSATSGPGLFGSGSSAIASGGFSTFGNGGTGGDITITGASLLLAGVYTNGGSTTANGFIGKDAGNIKLTATASLGDAVVLYGEEANPANGGSFNALAGSGPAGTGRPGTFTIQGGPGGAPLAGTADIRLQSSGSDHSNPAIQVGPNVVINTSGIGGNGAIVINGPIVSTTAGVETLTINGVDRGDLIAGVAGPLTIPGGTYGVITTASAVFTGGTVSANDIIISVSATLAGGTAIDTHAANGVISLGTVDGAQDLTLTAGTGTVALGRVGGTIALGNLSVSGGTVGLQGSIQTSGGSVTIGGGAVLRNSILIDTTNGSVAAGGAPIAFTGTLDGVASRANNLTLTAGTLGDIGFGGRVGVNDIGSDATGDVNGTRIGNLLITGARNVDLSMPFGTAGNGFSANSFAIGSSTTAGAASLTASSFINVNRSAATPGIATINTTGDVTIGRNIRASGSFNPGDPGGAVTIVSDGNVSIGSTIVQSFNSGSSIQVVGFSTTAANQPTGPGGTVTVTAKSIDLAAGVIARGGDSDFAGNFATSTGGAGGSITLTAIGGNVTVGTASSGTAFIANARGGDSVTGRGGAGGTVAIGGTMLLLTGANARGGDTLANNAAGGGAGGNVTLTASAASGDAVVIYGNASTPAAGGFGSIVSRGGLFNVTTFGGGTTPESGGTVGGAGGNILIQGGANGVPLAGFVRLVTSADSGALNGGSTVVFSSAGGSAGTGGTTMILGSIDGTTPNGENLRFGIGNGGLFVSGAVGAPTVLNTLSLSGDNAIASIGGAVTLGTAFLDQQISGRTFLGGLLTVPTLTMSSGSELLALGGGASITSSATLSGTVTAPALSLNVPVTLAGATTVDTSAANGAVMLGTVDGAQALTLTGGRGAVALGTVGGITPLTSLTASGGSISLSSVSATGAQSYTGTTTLGDNSTLTTAGGVVTFNSNLRLAGIDAATQTLVTIDSTNGGAAPGGGDIVFGGTVNGTFYRQQSLTLAAGTAGNITFNDQVGGVQLGKVKISSVHDFTALETAAAAAVGSAFNVSGFELDNGTGAVNMPAGLRLRYEDNTQAVATLTGSITITTAGAVTIGAVNSNPNFDTGVQARGVDASTKGEVAGSGGTISITGSSITLPGFLSARGGNVTGTATENAGNAGAVTLTATNGDIVAGADGVAGNSVGASGGSSVAGSGGNAASLTITATHGSISLPGGIIALAGSATGTSGNGGNGGALTLIATNGISTSGNITIGGPPTALSLSTSGGNAAVSAGSAVGIGGAGAPLTMIAGGLVTVFGPIQTSSGQGTQSGDASGAILITAGGDVSLGSTATSGFAVNSSGHVAAVANQGTGNGGAITIFGADISLPNGVSAAGGNGNVANANGGNAAPIILSAPNGLVSIGSPTSGPGNFSFIADAAGGVGSFGNGGAGANISIAATRMQLSGATSLGGGAANVFFGGNAGNITLTATATSGDAVVLYGHDSTLAFPGTLDASGNGPLGQPGTITIQGGPNNAPLALGADIRLQASGPDNSNPTTHVGPSVVLNTTSRNGGGAINIGGPIVGTTAGVETLTIAAGGGAVTLGDVGGATALSSVTVSGGSISLASVSTTGAQSYTGPTTLAPNTTIKTAGGAVTFNGNVRLVGIDSATATVETIDTTNSGLAGGGPIAFNGTLDGNFRAEQSLALKAGNSDISFAAGVGEGVRLGDVTVSSVRNFTDTFVPIIAPNDQEGFVARSFALTGTGNMTMPGGLKTKIFENDAALSMALTSGPINIVTSGVVSIGTASIADPNQSLGLTSTGAGASIAGLTAGAGGDITIIAASINLPSYVSTRGGDVSGSAFGVGGRAGALRLTTTAGDIFAGNLSQNTAVNTNNVSTRGGNSSVAAGGDAGIAVLTASGALNLPNGINARGGDVTGTSPGAGGQAGTITLLAGGAVTVGVDTNTTANARGGNSAGIAASGNGNAITINAAANVSVPGGILAIGGNGGGSGGTISIAAGGDVDAGTGAPAFGAFSLSTRGGAANLAGQNGGNGGTITVSSTTGHINVPLGVYSFGGFGGAPGSNGGNAGAISLSAPLGRVTLGTAAAGRSVFADAAGGASTGGKGGAGAPIDITGTTIALAGAFAEGGDTTSARATNAGSGGNITLTATGIGDALTIYGNASAPGAGTFGSILSRGGLFDVTSFGSGTTPELGGTVGDTGGNILIQGGAGAAPLAGVVRLMTATDGGTLNGGPSVLFSSSGGSTGTGGTTTILGSIEGSTANSENLRFGIGNGSLSVSGGIGDATALKTLTVTGGNAIASIGGAVTLGTAFLDQQISGRTSLDGLLTVPTLTMSAGSELLAFNGGASITSSATLSGTVTAPTLSLTVPVTLAGATTIDTSAANGALTLGTVDGAQNLTLTAGIGPVALGTVGGVTPLTALTASGGLISLASVSTTGVQSYTGATTLGGTYVASQFGVTGATTLGGTASVSAASGIAFRGPVDGAQALTLTGGTVTLGPVGGATPLSSLTASGGPISLASVSTIGAQNYTGSTTLGPGTTLTTAGGAVTFNSSVTLDGADPLRSTLATIDTTSNGSVTAGAGIHFAGTLGATKFGLGDLKLTAGLKGDVVFDQTVLGVGALTVASARNVQINAPFFDVRSLAITATGSVSAVGSISTNGQSDSGGGLQDAGDITINADGAVSLGSPTTAFLSNSVTAVGGFSTIAGTLAGNGGAISITGATIELPGGFETQGGVALSSSTSAGGNGGSVTLHAAGPVRIGAFGGSAGGGSVSADGGAGGALSIMGTEIQIASAGSSPFSPVIDASGGSPSGTAGGKGGKAGSIELLATAGDVIFPSAANTPGAASSFLLALGGGSFGTGQNGAGGDGGAISVSAAGNIQLADIVETFGGFANGIGAGGAAGSITLRTTAGGITGGNLSAFGGSSAAAAGGPGRPIAITSGGAVSFGGQLDTASGTGTQSGDASGSVTIHAGSAIAIGSIFSMGHSAFVADQGAGTGGAVDISGGSIALSGGINAQGGDASGSSTSAGGNGGGVTLRGSGAIVVGSSQGQGITSSGGSSASADGGAGGAISITGSDIQIASAGTSPFSSVIVASGGSALGTAGGKSGTAGSIELLATAGNVIFPSAANSPGAATSVLLALGGSSAETGQNGVGGDGGVISISAAGNIQLPDFVETVGGFANGIGAGGAAGPVTLRTTSGGITGGNLFTVGGSSVAAAGGSGAPIAITSGGSVSFSGVLETVSGAGTQAGDASGFVSVSAGGNVAIGSIFTFGHSANVAGQGAGNGGAVNISAAGIALPGGISAVGGNGGGSGGTISIAAGGDVDAGIGAPAFGASSLSTRGGAANLAGQNAGNGGTITVSSANGHINVPLGVYSFGGFGGAPGSNGGNAGAISLSAPLGSVTLGTAAAGHAVFASAAGGGSTGGRGGAGAPVDIAGTTIALAGAIASGGDTTSTAPGTGGAGGSITLTATAAGDAVTIFGNASAPGTATFGSIFARGGVFGDTTIGDGTGTIDGHGGNITIQGGAGATPLAGIVRLVASTDAGALNGGSSVTFSSAGGSAGAGGTTTILGSIEGATANNENLRFAFGNGGLSVSGAIGDTTALKTLTVTGGNVANGNGTASIGGAVTLGTALLDQQTTGRTALGGILTVPTLTMSAGSELLALGGGASITSSATLSGMVTAPTLTLNIPITLVGATAIDTSAANGALTLGTVDGAQNLTLTAGTGSVTLGTVGGVAALGSLTVTDSAVQLSSVTTAGGQIYNGLTTLGAGTTLTTSGGAVTFNSNLRLAGVDASTPTLVTIDSTNGGAAPTGAAISFDGTLDGSFSRLQSLTLTAGNSGDITFGGRVGINNLATNGVRLGDVVIHSANAVNLAMVYGGSGDGFAAKSFTVGSDLVPGAARLTASSYIDVSGAGVTSTLASNGGTLAIDATGDITVARNLGAFGGFNATHGAGNGGTVSLVSGGSVTVNTTDAPAQTGFNTSTFSIGANGFDANSSGSPGNGGSVSISAVNINLPLGVFARGGDAQIAGPNGGNGGTIALTATGDIAIGSASSGTVAGANTRGGASRSGSGGAGGTITMTASTMELTQVSSRGGDTQAASGGGNAGHITLTATATSGDAVTLYGVDDVAANATLVARGGRTGAAFTAAGTSGGTLSGAGGDITIQGDANAGPLAGTSDVRLATSTATALGGGSAVSITSAGRGVGGAITIAGPIAASTDNVESLRLSAQSGIIAVRGTIGTAGKRVNALSLVGNAPATIATVGGLGTLDLTGMTAGLLTFTGAVDIDTVTTSANPYSIAFNGGGTLRDPVFSNTGTLAFNGLMNVPGGLVSDAPSSTTLNGTLASSNNAIAIQRLVIGGDSTITTGTAPIILGLVDGAHGLSLAAGTVMLGNVGSTMPLSSLTASGGSISLASVSTTGAQSYTGPTTLGPGTTLTTAGGVVTFNSGVTLGDVDSLRSTLATIDATDNGNVTSGAEIHFVGMLDGAQSLSLASGAGPIIFGGPVGAETALTRLQVTSSGSVTANSITAGSVQIVSSILSDLGAISASGTAGILLQGGNFQLGGALATAAGNIALTSSGAVHVNAPITATGGDVTFDNRAGTGITIADTPIQAQSSPVDLTRDGTVTITGIVALAGEKPIAGTGRTVALLGPPELIPPPVVVVPPTPVPPPPVVVVPPTPVPPPAVVVVPPAPVSPPVVVPPTVTPLNHTGDTAIKVDGSTSDLSTATTGAAPAATPPPAGQRDLTPAALNLITPQAGGLGELGDPEAAPEAVDSLATTVAGPMQYTPAGQAQPKKTGSQIPVISGLLNQVLPSAATLRHRGLPGTDDYSSWGNEAEW